MQRASILTTFIAAGAVFFSASAHAATDKGYITIPPPSNPVYEVNPGERPGYILTPGYWSWNGSHHVWQHSRWVEKREGYQWIAEQWEQRGNKWHLAPGHWVEDEAYEDEAAVDTAQSAKPKKAKKRKRKIDYSDREKWPYYRHH